MAAASRLRAMREEAAASLAKADADREELLRVRRQSSAYHQEQYEAARAEVEAAALAQQQQSMRRCLVRLKQRSLVRGLRKWVKVVEWAKAEEKDQEAHASADAEARARVKEAERQRQELGAVKRSAEEESTAAKLETERVKFVGERAGPEQGALYQAVHALAKMKSAFLR